MIENLFGTRVLGTQDGEGQMSTLFNGIEILAKRPIIVGGPRPPHKRPIIANGPRPPR